MGTPRDDDTTWVGRARARPPVDPWPTAEQPVVPSSPPLSQPTVVYVEAPARRRVGLVIGLMLICFAAGGVVAAIASPSLRDAIGIGPGNTPSSAPSPTPSPTPTTPPPPGIGDPVRDGTFEFLVTDVTCGVPSVGSGVFTDHADGQFCIVGIGVKNTGNLPALFVTEEQWAIAVDGSRHHANSTAGVIANHGLAVWVNVVTPGDTVAGKLVFDIPADATLDSLELHDSGLSHGVLVTVHS
jgi:hypothetical protein